MIVKSQDRKNPEGSVLLFALVVMMLMGLMAGAIFMNTRSELTISGNTKMGRDAFTNADSTARVALLLARVYVQPSGGHPRDYLAAPLNDDGPFQCSNEDTDEHPFTVCIHRNNFVMAKMPEPAGKGLEEDIRNRYLAAAAANSPHVILKHNGRIVGTAAVAIDEGGLKGSNGGGNYGDLNGPSEQAVVMVTAIGRVPLGSDGKGADYYTGNVDSPHSVVTVIYREAVN